ncbi:hypothetical protein SNEBB_010425, partial [Seison nebaliae]
QSSINLGWHIERSVEGYYLYNRFTHKSLWLKDNKDEKYENYKIKFSIPVVQLVEDYLKRVPWYSSYVKHRNYRFLSIDTNFLISEIDKLLLLFQEWKLSAAEMKCIEYTHVNLSSKMELDDNTESESIRKIHSMRPIPIIHVSWIVLQELDGLKLRDENIRIRTNYVLKKINEIIVEQKKILRNALIITGFIEFLLLETNQESFNASLYREVCGNDDKIMNSIIQFRNKYKSPCLFLTKDNGLITKCHCEKIEVSQSFPAFFFENKYNIYPEKFLKNHLEIIEKECIPIAPLN